MAAMTDQAVRHYRGNVKCPLCEGSEYDPELDLCRQCDPSLCVYRVVAISKDWFDNPLLVSPSRLSSRRNVGIVVNSLLQDDTHTILVQRVR